MEFALYKTRPLWTHSYIIPAYFYPVSYWLGTRFRFGEADSNGVAISIFFLALIQGFLFLSSFWGSKVYEFSKLQKVANIEEAELIKISKKQLMNRESKVGFAFVNSKIAVIKDRKERIKWFEFDNDLFYFNGSAIKKMEIKTDFPLDKYTSKEIGTANMLSDIERVIFPKNEFKIEPPTFIRMFAEHAVSPFFVFQIFCALLWMLDEYWKYSLFTFFTIIAFEGGMVFQRHTNIKQLRSLNLKPQKIMKYTNGKKEEVVSSSLVPGDRIFIEGQIQMPADLLLIKGTAVINESMLSGETTPVQKEAITSDPSELSLTHHKKSILYGGTKILKLGEKGIECIVLRTGFMTEQGELIKSMIASEDTVSENNYEAYLFILAMLVFAIISCVYVVRESVAMGKTLYKIVLECIMILTNVVPPELPMELTIAVNSSLQELVGLGVYCLEPFRIPFAGKITVCCFDKTGTLTELNLQLEKIEAENMDTARKVIGTCHSLVILDGKAEGDPLDMCGFEYVKGTLVKDNLISIEDKTYSVLKKYSFDSALKRSTSVLQMDDDKFVSMKGAPETIREFLKDLPADYDRFEKYAEQGYRVIALAMKTLNQTSKIDLADRKSLEEGMAFAGFAFYNSKLKKNAQQTIDHLMRSNHKVIMITGDNEKTAISVAKQVGLYNGKSLSGSEEIDSFLQSVMKMSAEEKSAVVWPSVFARADPDSKEKTISLLNSLGEYTLMCGDGTNDVGALKTAHAGIALLEGTKTKGRAITLPGNIGQSMFILDEEIKVKLGDASIAAPFTSRTGSLQSVIDVISRGRSALVSTVQMYKVLALNCLLSAYTLSVFDTMGIKYGDFQMTAAGVLSAVSFTFFGKSRPLPQISKEKPVARIFSRYIVVSVILQTAVHIAAFYFTYQGVIKYGPIVMQEKFSPSLANTSMFLLGSALQVTTLVVNYVGRPFRESLTENKKLLNSLVLSVIMVVACTLEMMPDINAQMELVSIPLEMKMLLLGLMAADFALCMVIEKTSFEVFMRRPSHMLEVSRAKKLK
ncbi:manganese-transporting P-type ATPase [Nematocida minor]|uniref:manganese-transporting P-type ATPase n=1 Tax=Nematocida minor TaxID=1912983 RepID=UPI00221EEC77|nr:manganese-transporting P-type ATPase [Nematocida minor]KAI5193062.1 manganese-transporting P-type ATPase [Nematocida minor]